MWFSLPDSQPFIINLNEMRSLDAHVTMFRIPVGKESFTRLTNMIFINAANGLASIIKIEDAWCNDELQTWEKSGSD